MTYHVVRDPDGGWSLLREGASRISGRYDTRREAVSKGRMIIKAKACGGGRLYIHHWDGRVKARESFDEVTNPAKG